jgi:thiol-disulfide isomerase/thioredoxin
MFAVSLYGCSPSDTNQTLLDNPPQETLKKSAILDPLPPEEGSTGLTDSQEPATELEAPAPALEEDSAPQGPITYDEPPTSGEESPGGASGGAESAPAPAQGGTDPGVGFAAPDFSLKTLDGGTLSLSDLRGKNIMLNYWASWCIPCMEELPILEKIHQDYRDGDLVIVTVNGIQQDDLGTVNETVGSLGLTLPVVLDEGESIWNTYLVRFLPTSFFIDDQGIIRNIQLGSVSEADLRLKIDRLISDQL